ncbi:MAG: DUF5916 domain-containing protein [Gemmatimonadota bacterium]|nr:DUF5916 domain-containing protein [Gemmatimonadota bacterium]MDH3421922.1 DUF5916 domain-containing protein [Gemmatimonadota bacterium]
MTRVSGRWTTPTAWALALLLGGHVSPAAAQVADVEAAVTSAMTALNADDVAGYIAHFAPQARVLMSLGQSVEVDPATLSLADLAWTPGPVNSQVFGSTAVTVLELRGGLRVSRGPPIEGPWRYAETRVRIGGTWRIVEVEFSLLEPPPEAAGGGFQGEASARLVPPPPLGATSTENRPATTAQAARASPNQPVAPPLPAGVPPAPRLPEVITRDGAGNATVRAVRLDRPLDLDGELGEPVYQQVPPLNDFIQSLPDEGVPATELTEAWILYDEDNVYVSARVFEEVPERDWVANEMRRDAMGVSTNDNFGLVFDTYYDRRNGYFFYTNPLGAMVDVQVTNEGSPNFDWNPVWDVRTGRFEGGWTVEVKIPFKSIKYRPGTTQVWGVQLRRAIRRKNEWSHLTAVSRAAAGDGRMGIIRMSRAATLVGIEAPPTGVTIDVKPYGIASMTTDRTAASPTSNELDGDGGVDIKWSITQNLTADFTYNTDFAQVEVDEQQVNLTRFSLFFPEKREFFLESRGIFNFPSAGVGAGGGGGGPAPTLFFSRRIGILGRTPVPIIGGGRVTGKIGPFDVGALDIVTDDVSDIGAEMTNFTVLRLRADVLQRSNIGGLYTRRSRALAGGGPSETYGGDASFSFLDDWYLSGYLARTRTPGVDSLDISYQGRFSYDGDLLGLQAGHLLVEDEFNPEVGFVRRWGFRQSQASARLSPRPQAIEWIRQITLQGDADYVESAEGGYVESREVGSSLGVELESSDQIRVGFTSSYENLLVDESISGATVAAGRHSFDAVQASYTFGPQRFFSGNVSARFGEWFNGHLTAVGFSRGRIGLHPQLSVEPSLSFNRVELPTESFDTWLAVTRVNYTFSPRMFLSALVQYNSSNDSFSANARFRWEWAPGSEIFLVYTEERDTYDFERFPVLQNRGLVLKVTRLLRL